MTKKGVGRNEKKEKKTNENMSKENELNWVFALGIHRQLGLVGWLFWL